MNEKIHPTAIIHQNAKISDNVEIGAFSVINEDVEIGSGTVIHHHVVIDRYVKIGKNNRVFSGAVIGSVPQDLKFSNEISHVEIGDSNTIRECVTISRGTKHGGLLTKINDNNLLMANSHVAHDCFLGSHIVLANASMLAGHVILEDHVIIGGLTGVHQFTHVGKHSIVGGMSRVSKDIMPFSSAACKGKTRIYGINSVGLKRHNFSIEDRMAIEKAFRIILNQGHNTNQALEILEADKELSQNEHIRYIINFVKNSKRGITR